MFSPPTLPPLQIAFLLFLLLCLVQAQDPYAPVTPEGLDYTIYPVGARQCVLDHCRKLSCNRANGFTWMACVCDNGENIVFKVASCVKESGASAADMASLYGVMKDRCVAFGTPISVPFNEWVDTSEIYYAPPPGGGSGNTMNSRSSVNAGFATSPTTKTTATRAATQSATQSPSVSTTTTENGDAGGTGLSKSDQIALGAGISGGVLALAGVVITWRMYRQGKTVVAQE